MASFARAAFVLVLVAGAYSAAAFLPQPWSLAALAVLALASAIAAPRAFSGSSAASSPKVVTEAADDTDSRRLGALLDAAPVGVIIVGEGGRIVACNATAAAIFEIEPERAIGRTVIESIRNFELDRRLQAALSGEPSDFELDVRANERRLRVSVRPSLGGNGRGEAIAVALDLTRVRELESMRRDFVANVSHELRTPLTAVKIMVETLQDGADAATQTQFLENIARETERMIALVQDLLDLARLESGGLDLRLGLVDINALCKEAVEVQQARAERAGIALHCEPSPEPTRIAGDRDKIFQVVSNLLDNALRFTSRGGHVDIAVEHDAGAATIVVSDDGPGISSDALPHIFQRFYVADRSRARSAAGTGLGLAIVKHIVEAHGGSITAQSELSRGTTFRARFPGGGTH